MPPSGRAVSLTIVGVLDVVIGSLGLVLAEILALAAGVLLWILCVAWFWGEAESPWSVSRAVLRASDGYALAAILPFASVLADACLIATGVRLLDRSGKASRLAIVYACLIVPLAAVDVSIARHSPYGAGYLIALSLLTPALALAQVAAFYVVPSWRALTTGSAARSTS